MKYISLLLVAVSMVGCSLVPDSLEVADKNTLVEYTDVTVSPEDNVGKPVRWGGVIAKVDNQQDVTIVEVVQLPIHHYGRPNVARDSEGRYRVYVEDFLDPVVYQPGRSITFVGEVKGSETGEIGEHTYFYPTISASSHELWSDIERIDVTSYHYPYFGYPYYGRGFFGRGLYGRGFYGGSLYGRGFGRFGGFGHINHHRAIIRKNPFRSAGFRRATRGAFVSPTSRSPRVGVRGGSARSSGQRVNIKKN